MSEGTTHTDSRAEHGRLRFEMRQLLGAGSFGEVYLATMSSSGGIRQEVAVKILNEHLDPRSQPVERLRDEGRILGSLNHPVILQVRDLVVLKGRVGLVTEYVQGADLSHLLEETGPLPLRPALQVVGHVGDALDTAYHATASDGAPLHLLHRDIKPANIRVTPHGTVKLLDFGIAKAQEPERETATTHTMLIGSLPYMSPEVLHLDGDEQGTARDVFALGCTLFEALTGRLFFEGLQRKELRRQTARRERYEALRDERLRLLEPMVPPEVFALVLSMLDHDPAARPTARDVADRAHGLADDAGGDSLRAWARSHSWPEERGWKGAWTGQQVVETTVLPSGLPGAAASMPDLPVRPDLDDPTPSLVAGMEDVDPFDAPEPAAMSASLVTEAEDEPSDEAPLVDRGPAPLVVGEQAMPPLPPHLTPSNTNSATLVVSEEELLADELDDEDEDEDEDDEALAALGAGSEALGDAIVSPAELAAAEEPEEEKRRGGALWWVLAAVLLGGVGYAVMQGMDAGPAPAPPVERAAPEPVTASVQARKVDPPPPTVEATPAEDEAAVEGDEVPAEDADEAAVDADGGSDPGAPETVPAEDDAVAAAPEPEPEPAPEPAPASSTPRTVQARPVRAPVRRPVVASTAPPAEGTAEAGGSDAEPATGPAAEEEPDTPSAPPEAAPGPASTARAGERAVTTSGGSPWTTAPPVPTTGTLLVEKKGDFPVELRRSGKVRSPGEVDAGTWEVWADFGSGMEKRLSVDVAAGDTARVQCLLIFQICKPG